MHIHTRTHSLMESQTRTMCVQECAFFACYFCGCPVSMYYVNNQTAILINSMYCIASTNIHTHAQTHTGTLPAPKMLNYDRDTSLLSWYPPSIQYTNLSISTDLKITQYKVYITDSQIPGQSVNVTTTTSHFVVNTSSLDAISSESCNLIVQVSGINPYGEGQKSTIITINGKKDLMI